MMTLPLLLAAALGVGGLVLQVTDLPADRNATQGRLVAGAERITGKYTIGAVPDSLRDRLYVTIDRGEMNAPGASYSFTVNCPVTVYIATQDRGKLTLPEGWTLTEEKLEYTVPLSGGGTRKFHDAIYKRSFPAGLITIPPHNGTDGKYYGLPHLAILEPSGKPVATVPAKTPPVVAAKTTASAPLHLPDAELKPGKLVEFKIPLTAKAWAAACQLPRVKGEQALKAADKVETVKVSLAVPVGFTPDKSWPVLIAHSTDHRPNSIMAGYFTKPGTDGGWVVLAADATPVPADDSNQWRWALVGSALEYLQAQWPGLAKWPVACGGFSGGAKRSGFFGAIMMRTGHPVIGMWMGGCNQDMATPGSHFYSPGAGFKHVPIFLSSGKSDNVATPQHHRQVQHALKASGFSKVRLESYDGGHKLDESQASNGLAWFLKEAKH